MVQNLYTETVLLGVLISLLYTEVTGFSAGLVVPGYLVLSLHSPVRLIITLLVAIAAVLLCRGMAHWLILYGRRRFTALLCLTFVLGLLLDIWKVVPGAVGVIGVIIPGVIAREMDRQGILWTTLSLGVTTGILALILLAIGYPVFGV